MADYDGLNGHALKQKVNGATSYAPTMTSSSDDLKAKADAHTDSATMLTQVCDMLNDSWKGAGAEAARAHLKTMRDSVTNASAVNMTPAAQANQIEAEAHTDTNHQMVDMPDKPDHKNWFSNGAAHVADFFGGDAKTNDDLKNDWNSSNEHNIRVYQQYEQQSTNNSLAFDREFPDVKMPSDSVDSGHHSNDSVGVGSDNAGNSGGPGGATSASGAGAGSAGGAGSASSPSFGAGAGGGSGHGGGPGGAGFSGAPGAGGAAAFAGGSPSGHASGNLNKGATWKPSTPPSSAPFKDDKFKNDKFNPSDIPAASGGTSASGVDGGAGFDPSSGGGFGGSGFGSGSHQSGGGGGGAGGAGGAGMMGGMPMAGGVGMGAGAGGDQVRQGGGFGKGLGDPVGGGSGSGARSGSGSFGPQNAGAAAAESQAANAGRGGSGMGMGGAGAGRGKGQDDEAEHEDDYYMKDELDVGLTTTDEWGEKIVDETTGMVVPPEVIGDN